MKLEKIKENHKDVSGEKNPFYGKHHSEETKIKMRKNHCDVSGDRNPQWKGGVSYDRNRKLIYNNKREYIYEYRLIMEEHLGRKLLDDEEIHHIDLDPTNNKLENLQVMSHGEHSSLHRKLNTGKHFKCKPVRIDGIEYRSLSEASKELNISKRTISNRIKMKVPGFEFIEK